MADGGESAASAVSREYEASLKELAFNSKPQINALTIVADENRKHAMQIIRTVETRLSQVCVQEKSFSLLHASCDSLECYSRAGFRTRVCERNKQGTHPGTLIMIVRCCLGYWNKEDAPALSLGLYCQELRRRLYRSGHSEPCFYFLQCI